MSAWNPALWDSLAHVPGGTTEAYRNIAGRYEWVSGGEADYTVWVDADPSNPDPRDTEWRSEFNAGYRDGGPFALSADQLGTFGGSGGPVQIGDAWRMTRHREGEGKYALETAWYRLDPTTDRYDRVSDWSAHERAPAWKENAIGIGTVLAIFAGAYLGSGASAAGATAEGFAVDSAIGVTAAGDAYSAAYVAAAEGFAVDSAIGFAAVDSAVGVTAAADAYSAAAYAAAAEWAPVAVTGSGLGIATEVDGLIGLGAGAGDLASIAPAASSSSSLLSNLSSGASIADTIGSAASSLVKAAGSLLAPVLPGLIADQLTPKPNTSSSRQAVAPGAQASPVLPMLLIAGAVVLAFVALRK